MKLLANENFPLKSINILKELGFDITAIAETCSGITDKEVMKIAENEERTILTFDRDYGELIFKYGYRPKKGVIYFRWNIFQPEAPANFCAKLFNEFHGNFENKLTVIDDDGFMRQKAY